jgi:hypothetical protein
MKLFLLPEFELPIVQPSSQSASLPIWTHEWINLQFQPIVRKSFNMTPGMPLTHNRRSFCCFKKFLEDFQCTYKRRTDLRLEEPRDLMKF